MNRFAKPLLASAALCAASLVPAHAEIDVVTLKAAIEKSVEADYPKLDAQGHPRASGNRLPGGEDRSQARR